MRIIFMGTPDFAVPCLARLLEDKHEVCAVFTQPDKPKGRKQILTPPPVKNLAVKHDIPVHQPNSLRTDEVQDLIEKYSPDLIVVVAYGKILPESILNFPKYRCINVHASLLPKYRGAAPIQWSIIDGEEKTGVTTMMMEKGLDTGDMLLKSETVISDDETAEDLHDRLSIMGAQLMSETVKRIELGDLEPIPQDDSKSCYAKMLDKGLSGIDWQKNAKDIHNQVRGLYPWPSASMMLEGKIVKIHKTKVSEMKGTEPGEIISINPFIVSCGNSTAIEILRLQAQGGKQLSAIDYLRGHPITEKTKLN